MCHAYTTFTTFLLARLSPLCGNLHTESSIWPLMVCLRLGHGSLLWRLTCWPFIGLSVLGPLTVLHTRVPTMLAWPIVGLAFPIDPSLHVTYLSHVTTLGVQIDWLSWVWSLIPQLLSHSRQTLGLLINWVFLGWHWPSFDCSLIGFLLLCLLIAHTQTCTLLRKYNAQLISSIILMIYNSILWRWDQDMCQVAIHRVAKL